MTTTSILIMFDAPHRRCLPHSELLEQRIQLALLVAQLLPLSALLAGIIFLRIVSLRKTSQQAKRTARSGLCGFFPADAKSDWGNRLKLEKIRNIVDKRKRLSCVNKADRWCITCHQYSRLSDTV